MKTLKSITVLLISSLVMMTSCQDEIDEQQGENPNTNAANSETARNFKRTAMFDGSDDDFLDGNSCSSILLPVTAIVNGTEIRVVNESDYALVTSILAELNNDDDVVELRFPLTVMLSNYTELVVNSQSEYDALINQCEQAEQIAQDAISCVDIDYPVTILTYNLNFNQTGSIVFESEEQFFNYLDNQSAEEVFSINYPIGVTFRNGTSATLESDMDFRSSIESCLEEDAAAEEAEQQADNLEQFLTDNVFKIESFVSAGVETATDYSDYTIDFANDLTLTAKNTVNTLLADVEGTYEVSSELDVFLELNFVNNTTFSLLNQTYEVTSVSDTSIALASTADAAVTLTLTRI